MAPSGWGHPDSLSGWGHPDGPSRWGHPDGANGCRTARGHISHHDLLPEIVISPTWSPCENRFQGIEKHTHEDFPDLLRTGGSSLPHACLLSPSMAHCHWWSALARANASRVEEVECSASKRARPQRNRFVHLLLAMQCTCVECAEDAQGRVGRRRWPGSSVSESRVAQGGNG